MQKEEPEPNTVTIQLKHMELTPEQLTFSEPTRVLLKISRSNSSMTSQWSNGASRKFIFLVQETDEETPPLAESEDYLFQDVFCQVGIYHLSCINYPKIKATIQITKKESEPSQTEIIEPRINLPPIEMQNIVEVQEQQKQQQTKSCCEEHLQQHSHSKSDYAQYEKILNDENQYDGLPNRYLKYFKEQFKLWRDFFQREEQPQKIVKEKDKYGSQQHDKLSSSSLEISEKGSEKEESVISRLRSHQEISDIHEEELNHPKTMKKTNSQYCFNSERQVEKTHMSSNSKKRPFYTMTSSPHQRTEQSEAQTFIDWACSWTLEQGCEQIVIKKRGDHHLSQLWFTYLQNKFKISEFMHG